MTEIACATYENEHTASHVVDALLATGFPPKAIHVVVQRNSQLLPAPVGHNHRLGYAALIGAAVLAGLAGVLAPLAAQHGIVLPPPESPGLRPPAGTLLVLIPAGIVGALLGAAIEAVRWRQHHARFPAHDGGGATFVAVRVSQGNQELAERVLRMDDHAPHVAETEDPVQEARKALGQARAA